MSTLQTCCEICTPDDMDHIDRTFEERHAAELEILKKMEAMGIDADSFCFDLPEELAQKCLDLIVDGHQGSFEDIKTRAESELGKEFPDVNVKDFTSKKGGDPENGKTLNGKEREVRQSNISPDRLTAISKNYGGEIPQQIMDKLNNPGKFISKEEWEKLPGVVKGALKELRKPQNPVAEPYSCDINIAVETVVKHAFEKHRLGATRDSKTKDDLGRHGLYNEFPGEMRTVEHMRQEVRRILSHPTESKKLSKGREIYYDEKYDAVVVINHNYPSRCTFFQPAMFDEKTGGIRFGKQYFDEQK